MAIDDKTTKRIDKMIQKVERLINSNGNPVANHFSVVDTDGVKYLQSYQSTVVKLDTDGAVTLGADWDYSATTLKYVKYWLGISDTVKQMRKRIADGQYTLDTNL